MACADQLAGDDQARSYAKSASRLEGGSPGGHGREPTLTGSSGAPDRHDAHVQVLTAQVRTLVVGSRQVTMSVYNQLDEVRYRDIEPFGRVTPRDALDGWVYVVGRDKETGVLIRASLPFADWGVTENRKAFENELWRAVPISGEYGLDYAERAEAVARDYIDVVRLLLLANAARAYRYHAEITSPRDSRRAQWGDRAEFLLCCFESGFADLGEVANSWLELPKIVLAGLR